MKTYNHKKPLLSIHVPKCGGNSFKVILADWFKNNLHFHYYNNKLDKPPQIAKLKKNGSFVENLCIHGHFNRKRNISIETDYPEVDQFITIVRDPIEIQISNYFYLKKHKHKLKHFKDGKFEKKYPTVNAYLENTEPFLVNHFPKGINEDNINEFIPAHFIHIGIMESYQRSIDIFAKKLGKDTYNIPHKNKSERDEKPSKESIDIFKTKCKLDYLIYESALKLNAE